MFTGRYTTERLIKNSIVKEGACFCSSVYHERKNV
jgi:hypothetical protein